ncbi:MAG TPA: hypothetical protein VNV44_03720 [Solirubrobacteraceae bacterium]|jgi:hypothetical protein|nr:hypothetical protein [Solirubrobacteraceae bacterium]
MDAPNDTEPPSPERPTPPGRVHLPSTRASAVLAAAMLAIGVVVGAAIGPAPDASFAGGVPNLAQRLPLLIAALESHHAAPKPSPPAQAAATTAEPASAPSSQSATPSAASTTPATTPASSPAAEEPAPASIPGAKSKPKLPAVTNVWLIQLDGGTFESAASQAAAAPYITSQLLPAATLLSSWSALDAGAFASEAAVAEPPPPGATPPILHSIVQPPCPEGAAGAGCAPETPGQLTTADSFLKATLATITNTTAYKEHGLVVITFATVGIPTQSELPAGASTSQLTSQPPAGVALLSPFAKAGRSSVAFNPTSPRQSLEKLLR